MLRLFPRFADAEIMLSFRCFDAAATALSPSPVTIDADFSPLLMLIHYDYFAAAIIFDAITRHAVYFADSYYAAIDTLAAVSLFFFRCLIAVISFFLYATDYADAATLRHAPGHVIMNSVRQC